MSDAVRKMLLGLLQTRAAGATVCPSEVARALSPNGWRDEMAIVHATVDELVAEGMVRLSWKGEPMRLRTGPYRIGPPDWRTSEP